MCATSTIASSRGAGPSSSSARPGSAKAHLAISLGLAQLKRGYLVRFTTTQALLTRVLRAGGLDGGPSDLLVLDEFRLPAG